MGDEQYTLGAPLQAVKVFHEKRPRMSLMIFIFLCFLGLFVMFFFILRGQEKIHAALREEMAMLRAHMRQLESRVTGVPMPSVSEEQPPRHTPVQTTQASPTQADPLSQSLDRSLHGPLTMPDPLNSLSMDSSSTPPSGGLDLHFDPQQDFRR